MTVVVLQGAMAMSNVEIQNIPAANVKRLCKVGNMATTLTEYKLLNYNLMLIHSLKESLAWNLIGMSNVLDKSL